MSYFLVNKKQQIRSHPNGIAGVHQFHAISIAKIQSYVQGLVEAVDNFSFQTLSELWHQLVKLYLAKANKIPKIIAIILSIYAV